MVFKNIFDLSGKIALVTGGGRGLGRGMALGLAKAGANIVVADINPDNAKAVSEEIITLGRKSIFIEVDIAKKTQVKQMVGKILEEFNQLDIAVNSVGIPGSRLPSSEHIEEEDFRRFIDIMLIGTFFCCQEEAKQMIKQKKGKILI